MEDLNPTFGRFTASNFASHVVCGEITGNMHDRDSTLYHQDEYSRNVASLGGGVFEGSIGLAGSTSAFEKPNLRNRKALFDPSRFTKLKKLPVIYTIVTRLLLSPGAIGEVYCGGKIGSSQNLQTCVAPVIPGQSTCGVRSHVTKANGFHENNMYIRTPVVRNSVSAEIVMNLLQTECDVSY